MAGVFSTPEAPSKVASATAMPPRLGRAAITAGAAALALFALNAANFLDPIIGFDDYPTLFGWLDAYYGKTLSEGRWVNFLWQYHVGPIDRYAAFLFVVLSWCAICGLIAASVFRDDDRPWRAMLFAVAMAVAPPFAKLVAWSNTLVPVLALLLSYTAIAAWARPAVAAGALLIFAPLGLMSYTTSPIIMVLALALFGDWRGFRRSVALVALLAAGVGLGVLAIYLANWEVHGVFGMVADAWRDATPVKSAEDLTANVDRAAEQFAGNLLGAVHPAVWVGLLIFFGAPLVAYAVTPRRALPVLAVLGAGMGLVILHFLLSGVAVPIRAWPFVWLAVAALLALIARETARRAVAALAISALILMVVAGGYFWNIVYQGLTPFQTKTAMLAAETEATAPGEGAILVYGSAARHPAVRPVHNKDWGRVWSLAFRLHVLTGREACYCGLPLGRGDLGYCSSAPTEAICAAHADAASALQVGAGGTVVGAGAEGVALIRFGD